MKPDRANYEIWLIDYLDGTLCKAKVDLLISFLGENPDIREEFEEMSQYSVKPVNSSFLLKDHLKKSVFDITESQFELLCVAACENDLTARQLDELESILANKPEKRKIFEQIKSIRLVPPAHKYSEKADLHKQTKYQKIIRLSVIGMSAAASIAIMISLFNLPVSKTAEQTSVTVVSPAEDSEKLKKDTDNITPGNSYSENKAIPDPKPQNLKLSIEKTISDEKKAVSDKFSSGDYATLSNKVQRPDISKIDFKKDVTLREREITCTLIAINTEDSSVQLSSEKSGLNKFIAKTFRERIFKTPNPEKGSLKAYEIADAGINGLNKIFGWEMSLKKNKDEKGELKSVRFNSKFLKFNAPVKKTQLLP
jgi:hypothetical protein